MWGGEVYFSSVGCDQTRQIGLLDVTYKSGFRLKV